MALALDYPDSYLVRFCTEERETRAFAEVDMLPVMTQDWTDAAAKTEWRNKLAQAKCYMLACIEHQAAPDDLFTVKLKSYRDQFAADLARANSAAENTSNLLIFSVPLERA